MCNSLLLLLRDTWGHIWTYNFACMRKASLVTYKECTSARSDGERAIHLSSGRVVDSFQTDVVDVAVREIISRGRQRDVDLPRQVCKVRIPFSEIGDHVIQSCSPPHEPLDRLYEKPRQQSPKRNNF